MFQLSGNVNKHNSHYRIGTHIKVLGDMPKLIHMLWCG